VIFVKLVNLITSLPLWIIGSPTAIHIHFVHKKYIKKNSDLLACTKKNHTLNCTIMNNNVNMELQKQGL
jgi:hypothetical protein